MNAARRRLQKARRRASRARTAHPQWLRVDDLGPDRPVHPLAVAWQRRRAAGGFTVVMTNHSPADLALHYGTTTEPKR